MNGTQRVKDKHPAIAVKQAVLARSGVYTYSAAEMEARGYKPAVQKPYYTEYRPPEVMKRCKDKFAFAAVTREHTLSEVSPDNFRELASGVVGDSIEVRTMDDGSVGVYGNMAFYTHDAYDYYAAGNKETSADYVSLCKPDPSGKYDFVLEDIQSVSAVVVTKAGRGGPSVRVCDSTAFFGGLHMAGKRGVLGFLGIGRTKDDSFKLSKVVMDGLRTFHTLDAAGREKLAADTMSSVLELSESETRELLIGAVKDAYSHPVDVLAQEKRVADAIDGLYKQCLDADLKAAEEALKTKDSSSGGDDKDGAADKAAKDKDKDGDKDDKKPPTKDALDMSALIDAAVTKAVDAAVARVGDSMAAAIDKKVKEALGVQDAAKTEPAKTQDSVEVEPGEASFLLSGCFGS